MERKLLDMAGYVVPGIATLLSFLLFYYDTAEFWKSVAASLMTGALVYGTYKILRWLVLAAK
jgi:multisubunit Na+/H+ antiporter MnhB subunit